MAVLACSATAVLQLQVQFKDKPDVLRLMRRHPSWPAAGLGEPAAAVAGLAAAQPASQLGPAGAEQDPSDSEDEDSLEDVGGSDDEQDDMQDEVMSDAAPAPAEPAAPPAAAASPASARTKLRSDYTQEELAVMRELNLRHLTYVRGVTNRSGKTRWRVGLSAEKLPGRQGE